jgi:hypothetical protein
LLLLFGLSSVTLTISGGEKYISHGILFKFARDFQGLYGGDEYAMKATQVRQRQLWLSSFFSRSLHSLVYSPPTLHCPTTQHEIKGLSAYIKYSLNSRFPNTLHFPIMTVIGTRIPSRLAHALTAPWHWTDGLNHHRLQGLQAQRHLNPSRGLGYGTVS